MLISAHKFTETNKAFDELKNSRLYKLMNIIEENKDSENYGLTEQDEDWIVENIRSNSFFINGSIPLLGWAFDFSPICKEYWIKYTIQYGFKPELIAILAPNKEAAIRYVEKYIIFANDIEDCNGEILEIREPTLNKVWIAFYGCYSDRDVDYIASTKEQVEKYSNKLSIKHLEIHCYNIDEKLPEKDFYTVDFDKDFNCINSYKSHITSFPENSIYFDNKYKIIKFSHYARDAHHALKIASERLTLFKANPYLFPEFDKHRICIYDFITKEILKTND